jgi:hypothetical protein
MRARIIYRPHNHLRRVEERAGARPDPVDRLRFVREHVDPREIPGTPELAKPGRIMAWIKGAITHLLPVRRKGQENHS